MPNKWCNQFQKPLGSFFSVVVVDARDNKPPDGGMATTASLNAPCRGKRKIGGVVLASSVPDHKNKVIDYGIYLRALLLRAEIETKRRYRQ